MSDRDVDGLLRELAMLSTEAMDSASGRVQMERRAREARRGAFYDMSEEAVDARLRRMGAISALCVELASRRA